MSHQRLFSKCVYESLLMFVCDTYDVAVHVGGGRYRVSP